MKYLSEKYAKVLTHKGFEICVLNEANPSNGDSLGYVINDETFKGEDYNHPEDAVNAIDEYLK
jgi:hypothetical protein